jgi:hypothetical protein
MRIILVVYYATRLINAFVVTSFIRHERGECLIKRVTEKLINELHTIFFLRNVKLSTSCVHTIQANMPKMLEWTSSRD